MISVVIPTYNRLQFLLEAVRSVIEQSFRDWELIVVDDGSTDGTVPAIRTAFADSRIRVLSQPHGGVSSARNTGIQAAHNPWITFLDSDDLWTKHKLRRQLETLESAPNYRLIYTDEIWIRRGRRVNARKTHRKYGGWIYERCLPLCIVSPSSILIHQTILEQEGLFDESFPVCEDYELWLRISARRPVYYLHEPLIVKRGGHEDQLSRSTWGFDRYRVRALVKTYDSNSLSPRQKVLTAREIVRKSKILVTGCSKRNRKQEVQQYQGLIQRFKGRQ